MGYISAGRFPYKFEEAAYALQPGEISDIVESPVGYHLIKCDGRRPARGTVRVSHILILDQNGTPEESAARKARIDSIYDVVKANPGKFEEMAMRYSDDKGSARQGGILQWFGSGMMVQEFDSVAFALPVGEISEPVRTAYGWHIINKLARKDPPSLAEMKPMELQRISNPQDERYEMVKINQTAMLAKKHNAKISDALVSELKEFASANGIDSLFYVRYSTPDNAGRELMKIGKKSVGLSKLIDRMHGAQQSNSELAVKFIDKSVADFQNLDLDLSKRTGSRPTSPSIAIFCMSTLTARSSTRQAYATSGTRQPRIPKVLRNISSRIVAIMYGTLHAPREFLFRPRMILWPTT